MTEGLEQRHAFISYCSEDSSVAEQVCGVLESHGLQCWMAPRDVPPGKDWAETIVAAIKRSNALVLIFSDYTNRSPAVASEIEIAFSNSIPVFPFRIRNVQPSNKIELYIRRSQWIDAFTPPIEQKIERLAQAIRAILATEERVAATTSSREDQPRRRPRLKSPVVLSIFGLVLAAIAVATFLPRLYHGKTNATISGTPAGDKSPETAPDLHGVQTAPPIPLSPAGRMTSEPQSARVSEYLNLSRQAEATATRGDWEAAAWMQAKALVTLGKLSHPTRNAALARLNEARKEWQQQVALTNEARARRIAELINTIDRDRSGGAELAKFGGAAVPFLIDVLNDTQRREKAAEVLGEIGPPAKAALFQLVRMLGEAGQRCRWSAAKGIGGLGPEARPAVPRLISALDECLGQDVGSLDQILAEALGKIGDPAALPVLIRALQQRNKSLLRMGAAKALGILGDPRSVPYLANAYDEEVEAVGKDDKFTRYELIQALTAVKDKSALPVLIRALDDSYDSARLGAATGLKQLSRQVPQNEFVGMVTRAGQSARLATKQRLPYVLRFCDIQPPPGIWRDLGVAPRSQLRELWRGKFPGQNLMRRVLLRFGPGGNLYAAGNQIVAFDKAGRSVWSRPLGALAWADALAVDERHLYVSGYSGNSFVFLKYDSSGRQVWEQRYEMAARWATCKGLSVDDSGTVHALGLFGTDDVMDDRLIRLRIDSQGTKVAAERGPKSETPGPYGLQGYRARNSQVAFLDSSGKSYVMFGRPFQEPRHVLAVFAVSGRLDFSVPCGGFSDVYGGPEMVQADDAGNAYLAGDNARGGSSSGRLVKISAQGKQEWTKDPEIGKIRALCLGADDDFFVLSDAWPSDTYGAVTKMRRNGGTVWDKEIMIDAGSPGRGFITSMDSSRDGRLAVGISGQNMIPPTESGSGRLGFIATGEWIFVYGE